MNFVLGAGADSTRSEAGPPPIPTQTEIKTLRDRGFHWLVAENAVDLCLIGDETWGMVMGGNIEGETCEAVLLNRSQKPPLLEVVTKTPVDRPHAKLALLGRLCEVCIDMPKSLAVAS